MYKLNDVGNRADRVSNCIHAVSSIVEGYRLRVPMAAYGEMASQAVLNRMSPWILDRNQNNTWLVTALELDQYPIVRRNFDDPGGAEFLRPFRRALTR